MKYRFFAAVTVFIVLFSFSSCDKGKTDFMLSEFHGVVSFQCNGAEYSGKLEYNSADDICLSMTSPEHIKGIRIIFNGNEAEVSCDGLILSLKSLTAGNDVYTPLFSLFAELEAAEIKIKKVGTDKATIGKNSDIVIEILCDEMRLASAESGGIIYNFQYN